MLRRNFILLIAAIFGWPILAKAQKSAQKVWRIAYLYPGSLANPPDRAVFDVFRAEMQSLGYLEGKDLIIDARSADGNLDRLPALANELVSLQPNVFVAILTPAIVAAQKTTSSIPIVMAPSINPIGLGFVKSLARPGGNITGISSMTDDLMGKTAELFRAIVPTASRVGVLLSSNPSHAWQFELAERALESQGLIAVLTKAPAQEDLEPAFEAMKKEGCAALLVLGDATRSSIVTLAAQFRLPAIYHSGVYAPLGGLMSYTAKLDAMYRTAARYCDKIMRGADPAELPVEQPTIFELVLNLKTARALDLRLPDILLVRADRVIE
ncbi:ABC transporter substrate-binding protein [Bradyrhizobium centrosematis]|uniref:ABC transporter substrate-binding protein n=1 Tax=Bradyrhizobium centrosematis TaxID=1300039 RepID=UPI00216A8E8F|nr:ABC transporter substrate-binding protein [Bradyrhizobium centrosematis]MCS3763176.1 putative ABC transport system substrate-binding protein [Bradyrhizobium centrosematis]MCS3775843.1 putative ABC transport system substrate-binding protein [Bradyrhizobium centrosematis]